MPVLLKAANMICAVLRNGERLAAAARGEGGGGGGRGDRGPPGSDGGGGGGDRHRGPAQYNPSGPPPSSQGQPSPGPVNYQFQQQQPPVRRQIDCSDSRVLRDIGGVGRKVVYLGYFSLSAVTASRAGRWLLAAPRF